MICAPANASASPPWSRRRWTRTAPRCWRRCLIMREKLKLKVRRTDPRGIFKIEAGAGS